MKSRKTLWKYFFFIMCGHLIHLLLYLFAIFLTVSGRTKPVEEMFSFLSSNVQDDHTSPFKVKQYKKNTYI